MEVGIIGLPNVGKTTLFNVLTSGHAAVGNFPFTTKDKNVGVAILPDKRLEKLKEIYKPEKVTPALINFVDIAGLVKGASQGLGLGNQFLAYIREVDALIQVLRCFPDDKVVNTLNEVNPQEEIEIVQTELLLADLEQVERAIKKIEPKAKVGNQEAKENLSSLIEIKKELEEGGPLKSVVFPEGIIAEHFLTAKPIIYLANLAEKDLDSFSSHFGELEKYVLEKEKSQLLPLCVKLEEEITELDPQEREKFRQELGEKSEYLEKVIWSTYYLLNLVTFFTVVGTEIRAWTIPQGTTAVKAAGKVHTDMEHGFIKAEIFNYQDLEKYGSEKILHDKGLVRIEGKEYQISDGDIVHFRFHI
ncbi:MAG TPA: redox-regulated ATPase YchF [Elusimicrobia bacterium]|jgi:hypothetical protein|nr:redox-regulated ATPase YchF [Elusimicrobiota bacterium]